MNKFSKVKHLRKKDLKELKTTKDFIENVFDEGLAKYRENLFDVLYNNETKVYGINKLIVKNTIKTRIFLKNKLEEAYQNYKNNKTAENEREYKMLLRNYENYITSCVNVALDNVQSM